MLFSHQIGPLEVAENIFVGLHLCAQIEPELFELLEVFLVAGFLRYRVKVCDHLVDNDVYLGFHFFS